MMTVVAALAAALSTMAPPADHVAPTQPGPLQIDVSSGVVLQWAPSTDDRGPVRYEVSENGRQLISTNGTSFRWTTSPPPPMIYVFAVRAVDEAGNTSPAAFATLGKIWRGDEVPPAPTGLSVEPVGDELKVTWTDPLTSPPLSVPPTAGFEILIDGQARFRAGGTSFFVPTPPVGTHTIGVRTLNAVDKLSEPALIQYVVN